MEESELEVSSPKQKFPDSGCLFCTSVQSVRKEVGILAVHQVPHLHMTEEGTLKGSTSEMTQDLHIITNMWNLLKEEAEETVVSKKLLRSTEVGSEELGNR